MAFVAMNVNCVKFVLALPSENELKLYLMYDMSSRKDFYSSNVLLALLLSCNDSSTTSVNMLPSTDSGSGYTPVNAIQVSNSNLIITLNAFF